MNLNQNINKEVFFSKEAMEEIKRLKSRKKNPFIRADGTVDVDLYIEFLNRFNEFLGHKPKPFKPMTGSNFKM